MYVFRRSEECFENVNKIKPLRGKRNDRRAGIYVPKRDASEDMQRVEKKKKQLLTKNARKYKTRF
jgi:hypothetical protein